MNDAVTFLGPAFAMCLVIAALHVYLGMHVLAREVIFVDLSLAQLAALGAAIASVLEVSEEGIGVPAAGFALTVVGSAIFAFTRRARAHLSQEATVGIVYAVSTALMVLVLSRSPHGAEHIKGLLVGSLLLTLWEDVWTILLMYAVLGAVHWALARRFVRLSWEPDEAAREPHVELWDFSFYLLFGIAITISVRVAGVLLVFSFLIVPAVITRLFSQKILPRLAAGFGVSVVASVLGLWASWDMDLPEGATIVAAFGALLVIAGIARALMPREVSRPDGHAQPR